MLAAHWTGAAVTLGVLALVALAGYFAILAVLAVITRPRRPEPAPASMEVPGDESPAVAGFLANTWKVPRAAVPATLIDLAARRIVTIEEVSPEDFNVRLRNQPPEDLTRYERRVYDHVSSLADARGVVPCRALTTGPQDASNKWWKAFDAEVIADARRRGLTRNRWRGWEMLVLALAATIPTALGFVSLSLAFDETSKGGSNSDSGAGWAAVLVFFVILSIPLLLRAQRETAHGSEVASRWLGLQRYLRDDTSFADYPVASVAIWQRYLSYGAALGVARAAVAALPMGSESDREAWSKESGRWRLLRISYRNWPPGWGRAPGQVVFSGVVTAVVAGAGAFGGLYVLTRLFGAGRQSDASTEQFRAIGLWVVAGVLAIALFWLVSSLVWLSYAIPDLKSRTRLHGRLLRVREDHSEDSSTTWIAVDDGTAEQELHAFNLMHGLSNEFVQGCLVDMTISPRLGHVFTMSRVAEAGSTLPSRRVEPSPPRSLSRRLLDVVDDEPDAAAPPAANLDLAQVAHATGLQLAVASHETFGGSGHEMWELVDGSRGRIVLRRDASPALAENSGCALAIGAVGRLGRRRRKSVPGVGQWAKWSPGRSTLLAYGHGRYVSAIVQLADIPEQTRRDIAIALARQMV